MAEKSILDRNRTPNTHGEAGNPRAQKATGSIGSGNQQTTEDQDRADHKAAMAARMAQHAMAATLSAGATHDEAIAAGVTAESTALGVGETTQMLG